jgi:hypothetical protein
MQQRLKAMLNFFHPLGYGVTCHSQGKGPSERPMTALCRMNPAFRKLNRNAAFMRQHLAKLIPLPDKSGVPAADLTASRI